MDRIEPRVLCLLHPKFRPTVVWKWAPKKRSNGRCVPTSSSSSAGGNGPHDGSDVPDSQDTKPRRLRSFPPSPVSALLPPQTGSKHALLLLDSVLQTNTNKKRGLVPSPLSLFSWFPFDVWEVLPDCSPEFPAIMKFGEDRRYTLTLARYYFLNWKASKLWKDLL